MQTGDLENHVWNAQDCCTRAQFHDNSGKECPTVSVVVLARQQQLHWQRNRKTGDQTHRVKGCGLFQSQGNGSCRMQQFVIPGICRHQTTYMSWQHILGCWTLHLEGIERERDHLWPRPIKDPKRRQRGILNRWRRLSRDGKSYPQSQ